jgi:hypothetical protein
VAALIKEKTGITPEVIEGARGEFTVWVEELKVAQKTADGFPADEDALAAVQKAVGRSA